MGQIEIRPLAAGELDLGLFARFQRRQEVNLCWRRAGEGWEIRPDPFIDDWSPEDYQFLVRCLQSTLAAGGLVAGAFLAGELKGFLSVEGPPLGSRGQYADLLLFYVSEPFRGRGIGGALFRMVCAAAREMGAEKLYISAHSAAEVMAAYWALGCVEAEEIDPRHAAAEPCDVQLEFRL